MVTTWDRVATFFGRKVPSPLRLTTPSATAQRSAGPYGAFAGTSVHPWGVATAGEPSAFQIMSTIWLRLTSFLGWYDPSEYGATIPSARAQSSAGPYQAVGDTSVKPCRGGGSFSPRMRTASASRRVPAVGGGGSG